MSDASTPRAPWHAVVAALTPLVIGIGVTGAGAYFTRIHNERQLQLNQITALDKFRGLLASEDALEREFGYAAFAALGYEGLALRMIQLRHDEAGRALAQQVEESGSKESAQLARQTLQSLSTRVFLHIPQEGTRAMADSLAKALDSTGVTTMGVDNVADKDIVVPRRPEVRYFNPADSAAAAGVVETLRRRGVTDAQLKPVPGLRARPGTVEVWLDRR